jgi:hypothetical protein
VTTEAPDGSLCKEHAIVLVDEVSKISRPLKAFPCLNVYIVFFDSGNI